MKVLARIQIKPKYIFYFGIVMFITLIIFVNFYQNSQANRILDKLTISSVRNLEYRKFDHVRSDVIGTITDKEDIEEILSTIQLFEWNVINKKALKTDDRYCNYNLTFKIDNNDIKLSILSRNYMTISAYDDGKKDDIYLQLKGSWNVGDLSTLFSINEDNLK